MLLGERREIADVRCPARIAVYSFFIQCLMNIYYALGVVPGPGDTPLGVGRRLSQRLHGKGGRGEGQRGRRKGEVRS